MLDLLDLYTSDEAKDIRDTSRSWARLFCILHRGEKWKKIRIFWKIRMPQNSPKTHIWLKTEFIVVTGVFFYPIWTEDRPKSSTERPKLIFLVFLRVFCILRSDFFCLGGSYFFFDFARRLFFSASWSLIVSQSVPGYIESLENPICIFFYVKVMKRSHFFLSKIPFSGFCPYFHGRAHQGNFFFPISGVPLLTNRINQKLPWTGPKKTETK